MRRGEVRQVSLARLAEFQITPKRRLGQNFLIDDNILALILERLELSEGEVVLEVGAGLGVLTAALADAGAVVHAFEVDRSLEPALQKTLGELTGEGSAGAGHRAVTMYFRDILGYPLEELRPSPTVCASNLPYSVAGPFLAEALYRLPGMTRYCVMVQRDVAERLAAVPGGKEYGGLTVWVQLNARVEEVRGLSRSVFHPQPHVDSSLVTLKREVRHPLVWEHPGAVRNVIDAAFAQRRKTIVNSLSSVLGVAKPEVREALEAADIDPGARAEALPPQAFPRLTSILGLFREEE